MLISMQGNWSVAVKSKEAAYPQRFVVAGAISGNGSYDATEGMDPVWVTGEQWSLSILNDPGTGFRASDTRIKFPSVTDGQFVFDIESNDAGSDQDFNDLILTCSSPASVTDHIIYGNVTLYSNGCLFNPCYRGWLVIDTWSKYLKALQIDKIKEAVERLYPERIPPHIDDPNPPDPPFNFTPIMINVAGEAQLPEKLASVFRRIEGQVNANNNERAYYNNSNEAMANYQLTNTVSLSDRIGKAEHIGIDKIKLGSIIDIVRLNCTTEPGANLTLNFAEYDRTLAELAGGPYTGTGDRQHLGSAITDSNGNYIFRFNQSFSELVNEVFGDVAAGEDVVVQARPDVIVKVTDSFHPSTTLFESAPYFNVPQIRRINICLPLEKVKPSSLCFNGNLVGSLGNVFIGGNQNVYGSLFAAALNRDGYNNHLHADGKITVHNTQALFSVDCACWAGTVDVKGCLFNIKRQKGDPVIRHYTIRYRKPGGSWQFVNEAYKHPKFSKRSIPFYNGDLVGPFPTMLRVDGGALQEVSAYKNIQAEVFFDGVDWEWSNLDRYIQLNTTLYDANTPGTVYFMVEGYDENGNLVPNGRDLIALYINNRRLNFGLGTVNFTSPVESLPCNLYKLKPAQLNTPLAIQFKASDDDGFVDNYRLTINKCPQQISVNITSPGSIAGTVTDGELANGSNANNTDSNNCPGYSGTISDFATSGFVNATLQPAATEGGWMRAGEQFVVISVHLSAAMRKTNGYNTGIESNYNDHRSFYLELKP